MSLTIRVEDEDVLRLLRRTSIALEQIITPIAEEVATEARLAGGAVTPKLGAEWKIHGTGHVERKVEAPEWWAHFLAGGTKDHGPRSAPMLMFTTHGTTVRVDHVRGIAATHFDKKAVDRVKPRIRSIIERAIEEAAL